jgi:hypothetical protein
MKDVYAIYESKSDGRERSRWVRVGVAFENRDGSLNVLLDAVPLSGRLQIRSRSSEGSAEMSDIEPAAPVAPSGCAARAIADDPQTS